MSEPLEQRDPVELLAAEFMERLRKGESPTIAEYTKQYPDLAADIEDLFPTILAVERLKSHREMGSGPRISLGAVKLERLGDFRIIDEIGRGGMGIVYEAFQESLGRRVAVKVLPKQSLLDAKQLRRFQREAQMAARLHHTNIVPVFGVGEHEGFHYIVMQYIPGTGLDVVLAKVRASLAGTMPGGDLVAESSSQSRRHNSASRLAAALVEGRFCREDSLDPNLPETAGGPHKPAAGGKAPSSSNTSLPSRPAESAESSVLPASSTGSQVIAQSSGLHVGDTPILPPEIVSPASPDEARRLGLSYWRSVAVIGRQVAEALHYSHAHRTLHGDVKPANLLLDPQGVVWISDFGLAKAMEQDNLTQAGAMAGTLRYMAPEQFSDQMDARSDIYSLGLTLYEMLVLRPAFEETNVNRLIRKISHEEPVALRKVLPRLPRDLETIVLKAIAREPANRYQTAGELARDLDAFLDDRPIMARRTSPVERLWRWARRNRALAALTTSVLALLLIVAIVATVGYARTMRANIEEARQRKRAEDTSALAIEALDNIFQQFAPDRVAPASTSLVVGDEGTEITVPAQPVLSKETAALLEHMLAFYDRLAAQGGGDDRLLKKVAEANRRVGDIRQRLGQYGESKAAYQRAIELYSQLAQDSPHDAGLCTEIARIHNELGNVYWATNEPEAGQSAYSNALAMLKDVSGAAATSPQCRYELARTCYFLGKGPGGQMGRLLPGVGGPRRMEPGPMGFVFDPRGPHHEERGRRERDRGLSSLEPRPFDESQRLHKPGRPDGRRASDPSQPDDDAEPSARQPPDRHEFDGGPPGPPPDFKDGAPGDLAGTPPAEFGGARPSGPADHRPFFHGMHPGEGDDYLQQAIDLLKNLVEEQPNVPEYQHLLARCYREVRPRRFHEGQRPGDRSEEEKKPEAESATVAANKATAIMENLVKAYPTVADYRYDLSETYAMQGRPGPFSRAAEQGDVAQSRKNLEKALAISEELVAEHPNIPDYAASQVQHFLGLTELLWASNTAEAERSLRKAMDLQASLVRRYPQNTSFKVWLAVIHRTQAQFWQESDDLKESERLAKTRDELQESIKLLKEALATDQRAEHIHNVLAEHYLQLARVLRRQGANHAAAQAEKEAESLRKPWAPPPMAPMAL